MDREEESVSISEFPGVSEPVGIVRFLKIPEVYSPYTSAIIVATVGGALFFQAIFRKLEAWVEGKRHAKEVLQSMFKELAILGLVAFTLFAIDSIEASNLDEDIIEIFDFIHMAIFIITVLYTVFCGLILYLSTVTGRKWKYLEDIDIHNYINLKNQCDSINDTMGLERDQLNTRLKRYCVAIMHPVLYRRRRSLMRHLAYQEVRASFIRENNMPANFRFVIYLDKCKQHVVLQLAEIGETAWITLAVFVGFSMYYQAIRNTSDLNMYGCVLFISLVPVVVVLLVRTKVNSVYEEILYAENYFIEELKDVALLQNLFWLGRPRIIVLAFQLSQFALSVSLAMYLQLLAEFTELQNFVVGIVLIAAIFVYCTTLPQVINDFSMITHVGNLVDKRLLASALLKQQTEFKKVSMAPTLRQATMLAQIERKQNSTMKQRASRMMSSALFCELINYCILFDFTIVSLRMATAMADGKTAWTWTWYEILEIIFSSLFVLEGLLIIYVLSLRSVIRFEHPGASFDLLVIFITTCSSFLTAIYLTPEGHNSPDFDVISYLDVLIVLRLVRWTRRIFLEDTHDDKELEAHLSEVQILLEEQSDPRGLGGYFDISSNEMSTCRFPGQSPKLLRRTLSPASCNDSVVSTVSDKSLKAQVDVDEKLFYQLKQIESTDGENFGRQQVSHAQTERGRKTGPIYSFGKSATGFQSAVHHPARHQARKSAIAQLPDERPMDSTNNSKSCTPVVEAWIKTCQSHPDVAALHGGLSVAILRLMLNLSAERPGKPVSFAGLYHGPLMSSSAHSGYAHNSNISQSGGSDKLGSSSSTSHRSKQPMLPRTINVQDEYMRRPSVRHDLSHIQEIEKNSNVEEESLHHSCP